MTTLPLTLENADAAVETAARKLHDGGVVVIPTDTVYGLAAHPARMDAVARLSLIKHRPSEKPIALLAADIDSICRFGARISPVAERLAKTFWPGALTLVLDCGEGTEGFRVPAHAWTRCLLTACGGVLRVTSANLSGAIPASSALAALRDVGLDADLVIDDGNSPGGVPSTVVRLRGDVVDILRVGALSPSDIHVAATRP